MIGPVVANISAASRFWIARLFWGISSTGPRIGENRYSDIGRADHYGCSLCKW